MLARLQTFSLVGIDALPVEVEVELSPGALPKTVLVGLPEADGFVQSADHIGNTGRQRADFNFHREKNAPSPTTQAGASALFPGRDREVGGAAAASRVSWHAGNMERSERSGGCLHTRRGEIGRRGTERPRVAQRGSCGQRRFVARNPQGQQTSIRRHRKKCVQDRLLRTLQIQLPQQFLETTATTSGPPLDLFHYPAQREIGQVLTE
jgi:hypothetical protein